MPPIILLLSNGDCSIILPVWTVIISRHRDRDINNRYEMYIYQAWHMLRVKLEWEEQRLSITCWSTSPSIKQFVDDIFLHFILTNFAKTDDEAARAARGLGSSYQILVKLLPAACCSSEMNILVIVATWSYASNCSINLFSSSKQAR